MSYPPPLYDGETGEVSATVRATGSGPELTYPNGNRVHYLLISFWDSEAAIREYTGPDIDRAQYFEYDRECLVEPEPTVTHYEVVSAPGLLR